MIVTVPNATITTVYADSFKNAKGEEIEYYRSLVTVAGEAPAQLAVRGDDFVELSALIGHSGDVLVEVDARPGSRARVYLKGLA